MLELLEAYSLPILFSVTLAFVGWCFVPERKTRDEPPQWEPHYTVKPVICVDGTEQSGHVWRRRWQNAYQYRHMTDDEVNDNLCDRAW